ncbi:aminopeptidase N [Oxobacter pfennigii]|uniref:Aminopeptidase N n=1 Tax=Oxobacter pfennigii TaxID=36849 RepID=A0A0P8WKV2_9CLOT|nr:M1 family metallopeptidase [Oxobacter pfennigii]KPU42988.1 aminopeptidase N [Oxobacter pfennigii]
MIIIRHKKAAVIIILIIFIFTSGCSKNSVINSLFTGYRNRYEISVYYKPEDRYIFGTQKLFYKNTEDIELNDIYFHLYPNAFSQAETAPMIGDIRDNYPSGFNPGKIDIINVWVNGVSSKWAVEGQDKTILKVELNKPIKPQSTMEIRIDFGEKLPLSRTDFGAYNGIASFENWYPVLCVYDNEGWHTEPSCKMGEANFSEVSDYYVDIDLPENELVASTGDIKKEKALDNNRKIISIEAKNVRDFTWVSSSKFQMAELEHNGIEIRSFFLNEDRERGIKVLDYASKAMDFFSESFGEYPYKSFDIVETPLYGGAMEYPLLTAVGEQYYKYLEEKNLEAAVAHEIAHQWWYVIVGNNEYVDPWLDEALATYSEAMYFEKYYGEAAFKEKINTRVGMARFNRVPMDSMDKFKTGSEYNIVVYIQGAYILDEFRNKVGNEMFLEILKSYFETYKFKNANTDDFITIATDICGNEAATFLKNRLSGKN